MAEDKLLERSSQNKARTAPHSGMEKPTEQTIASSSKKTFRANDIEVLASDRTSLINSSMQLSPRQEMIRIISNRLFLALCSLMVITIAFGYLTYAGHKLSAGATNWMVLLCGAIGGFISLQRSLKTLDDEDLLLLARSWVYVLLSPLVGSILALLLFFLFISGLLDGDLFPNFEVANAIDTQRSAENNAVEDSNSYTGLSILFGVQGIAYTDYAKIVFWCFLAGYSESFVTNIISNFESKADRSSADSASADS